MPGSVVLSILEGPLTGQTFDFDCCDIFLFGRAANCHLCLPDDPFVSSYHCIMVIEPPDVRIRDLGSLNGTYVNGKKQGGRRPEQSSIQGRRLVFPEVLLKDGDMVQVGRTRFVVSIQTPPRSTMVIRCVSCKAPIAGSRDVMDAGDWLCSRCQRKASENPQHFLRTMLHQGLTVRGYRTGEQLADYKLEERLAEGGMGFVHLARSKVDGSRVVLKVLHSELAASEHNRKSFLREMMVLRKLEHPNVVQYKDYGDVGNTFFFVMEYCNRGTLEEMAAGQAGPLPWDRVAPLMLDVLRGLDYAHRRGIVHRDLKPGNVFLHDGGNGTAAKVGDFGLAKSFQRAGLSRMTVVGEYAGTYNFMAREQLTNFKYAKPACDVWSTGATFYHLLTQEFPRTAVPERDPIDVVLEDQIVPIQKRGVDVPRAVAKVINRSLSSDLERRYPAAGDMLHALEKVL